MPLIIILLRIVLGETQHTNRCPSSLSELLRSCRNQCGGTLGLKQGSCGHSGTTFFMSETEHACSCLCHPLFSRQKIPKNPHSRSFYLSYSANIQPKCLSTSTAVCQTSSIATKCPVWLPRYCSVTYMRRCLLFFNNVYTHTYYE